MTNKINFLFKALVIVLNLKNTHQQQRQLIKLNYVAFYDSDTGTLLFGKKFIKKNCPIASAQRQNAFLYHVDENAYETICHTDFKNSTKLTLTRVDLDSMNSGKASFCCFTEEQETDDTIKIRPVLSTMEGVDLYVSSDLMLSSEGSSFKVALASKNILKLDENSAIIENAKYKLLENCNTETMFVPTTPYENKLVANWLFISGKRSNELFMTGLKLKSNGEYFKTIETIFYSMCGIEVTAPFIKTSLLNIYEGSCLAINIYGEWMAADCEDLTIPKICTFRPDINLDEDFTGCTTDYETDSKSRRYLNIRASRLPLNINQENSVLGTDKLTKMTFRYLPILDSCEFSIKTLFKNHWTMVDAVVLEIQADLVDVETNWSNLLVSSNLNGPFISVNNTQFFSANSFLETSMPIPWYITDIQISASNCDSKTFGKTAMILIQDSTVRDFSEQNQKELSDLSVLAIENKNGNILFKNKPNVIKSELQKTYDTSLARHSDDTMLANIELSVNDEKSIVSTFYLPNLGSTSAGTISSEISVSDFEQHFKSGTWSDSVLTISLYDTNQKCFSVKGKTDFDFNYKPIAGVNSTICMKMIVQMETGSDSPGTDVIIKLGSIAIKLKLSPIPASGYSTLSVTSDLALLNDIWNDLCIGFSASEFFEVIVNGKSDLYFEQMTDEQMADHGFGVTNEENSRIEFTGKIKRYQVSEIKTWNEYPLNQETLHQVLNCQEVLDKPNGYDWPISEFLAKHEIITSADSCSGTCLEYSCLCHECFVKGAVISKSMKVTIPEKDEGALVRVNNIELQFLSGRQNCPGEMSILAVFELINDGIETSKHENRQLMFEMTPFQNCLENTEFYVTFPRVQPGETISFEERLILRLTEDCDCKETGEFLVHAKMNFCDDDCENENTLVSSVRHRREIIVNENPVNIKILNLDIQNMGSFLYDSNHVGSDLYKTRNSLLHAELNFNPKSTTIEPRYVGLNLCFYRAHQNGCEVELPPPKLLYVSDLINKPTVFVVHEMIQSDNSRVEADKFSLCGDMIANLTVSLSNDDNPEDDTMFTDFFIACEAPVQGGLNINVLESSFELDTLACFSSDNVESVDESMFNIKVELEAEVVCVDMECDEQIEYTLHLAFTSSNEVDINILEQTHGTRFLEFYEDQKSGNFGNGYSTRRVQHSIDKKFDIPENFTDWKLIDSLEIRVKISNSEKHDSRLFKISLPDSCTTFKTNIISLNTLNLLTPLGQGYAEENAIQLGTRDMLIPFSVEFMFFDDRLSKNSELWNNLNIQYSFVIHGQYFGEKVQSNRILHIPNTQAIKEIQNSETWLNKTYFETSDPEGLVLKRKYLVVDNEENDLRESYWTKTDKICLEMTVSGNGKFDPVVSDNSLCVPISLVFVNDAVQIFNENDVILPMIFDEDGSNMESFEMNLASLRLKNSGWSKLNVNETGYFGSLRVHNCTDSDECAVFYTVDVNSELLSLRTFWHQNEELDLSGRVNLKLPYSICETYKDLQLEYFSGWSIVAVALSVPKTVPVLFSAIAASAAHFSLEYTEFRPKFAKTG